MSNPRILDLFCGAGGAAVGYRRASFEVVGVDIAPQKHYPFPFILGDALDVLARMLQGERFLASDSRWYGIEDFDAIHASPPCQGYSSMRFVTRREYPKMVDEVRHILTETGKPFVIENVMGAPLINPLMLCGTMFGLRVIRHRLFECNPPIYFAPFSCRHDWKTAKQGRPIVGDQFITITGNFSSTKYAQRAMGIDWMTKQELTQAIPPAYTEYIGGYLMHHLEAQPHP